MKTPRSRRRPVWPRGLRIHRRNDPLAALSDSHPAKRALILHGECQRDCAGREIQWPEGKREAVDQVWISELDRRRWTFAGFVYAYICFDLILDGWLERPPFLTNCEREDLAKMPRLYGLLDECEQAAQAEDNLTIIGMLRQVREFLNAWEAAIFQRIKDDRLPLP
jgi:hypothetical protein